MSSTKNRVFIITSSLSFLLLSVTTLAFTPFLAGKSQFRGKSSTLLPASAITLDGEKLRAPISPVGNYVLVRNKETLSATSGGILLPDQVSLLYTTLHSIRSF